MLGIVGAMVPCQFTGNIGAITLYGNRSVQTGIAYKEILFFILGKIVAFTSLGLIIWILGTEVKSVLTLYFPWIRKLMGPILILIGVFMSGFIKMSWNIKLIQIPEKYFKEGKLGAFLLGLSFSLAFCPSMFIIFFVTFMPIVLAAPYGLILPSIFALGTSVPLLLAIFLIWYFSINKAVMKNGRKIGAVIQKIAGIFMIVLGILDTVTYWI